MRIRVDDKLDAERLGPAAADPVEIEPLRVGVDFHHRAALDRRLTAELLLFAPGFAGPAAVQDAWQSAARDAASALADLDRLTRAFAVADVKAHFALGSAP